MLRGVALVFFSNLRGSVVVEGSGYVKGEEGVAGFGGAILHDVFPLFPVVVFLGFSPRVARGEVESARVGGPGEGMHFFLALGYGNGFTAGGRNQVDLGGFSLVVFGILFVFS